MVKFSKKKSILSNFLTFFFSHTPQKNALNTSRSLILEGHKTQHTITCNKFYKVCLWCVEDSFFAPHGNTSLPTHATSTYYWFFWVNLFKAQNKLISHSTTWIGLTWPTRSLLQEADSWSTFPLHQLGP